MHKFQAIGKSGKVVTIETGGYPDGRKKVLIVDDEPDLRLILRKRLEAHGFNVSTADCGETGIAKAKKESPDLIILDVAMPGMDGGEVASVLKEDVQTKDTPIMFLSCLIPQEPQNKQPEVGGNHYMGKPYSPKELVNKVNDLIK